MNVVSTVIRPSSIKVDLPLEAIARLCCRYDVQELSIFGSALRDDFRDDSDVDFLARFRNNDLGPWLSKLTDFERELSEMLGRKVDVVSRPAVEASENYLRRRHILVSARTIYVA